MPRRPRYPQLDRRQVVAASAGLALTTRAAFAGRGAPLGSAFAGIETIVVLMMENRSFDHYFGMINHDPKYPCAGQVEALKGDESNPDENGNPVTTWPLVSTTQDSPPHSWSACHAQWDNGKNDGFVTEHAGASERDVMGYFDRTTLPFTYWLADNFTLCDHWYSGLLGPTWPNRAILYATDAAGKKSDTPYFGKTPDTIWDALPKCGKTGKNYYAGKTSLYSGMYLFKGGESPTASIDDFFSAAKSGTLPSVCVIEPDYDTNDDHPAHDVRLGQAMIASIYKALAASPQWDKCLFVLTYDEHGGFFDHVAPPPCTDADPDYRQLGFRVPSLVIGPTVRRSAVVHDVLEHSSVAATLATAFGMPSLTPRMAATADLSSCIDPAAIGNPRQPPPNPPAIRIPEAELASLIEGGEVSGQPELTAMIKAGQIPAHLLDARSRDERVRAWLNAAIELGALELV